MRALALVVAVAGCGRFGFGDERADGAIHDGAVDDAHDAPTDDSNVAPACLPAFQLCDGFEAATFDTTTWTVDPLVTIDSTRAHRGTQSVRVHTNAFPGNTSSYTAIAETKTIPGATTFWVRSWFWLSALPATNNGMELISAEQSGTGGDYVFVFSDETHIYSQFGNVNDVSMSPVPIQSWFCVVWKVARATTATGSIELTGDLPMLSMTNIVTDSSTNPMNVLVFGIGFASSNTPTAQPALDLWIDDVIVDDAPHLRGLIRGVNNARLPARVATEIALPSRP